MAQHSKTDLQRQVLENQKTIMGILSKQRTGSNDSRKSRSQNRKKSQQFQGLSSQFQDLLPKKQSTQTKSILTSGLPGAQSSANPSTFQMNSQAQILMNAKALSSHQHLLEPNMRFGSNHTQVMEKSNEMDGDDSVAQQTRAARRSRGAIGMQNSAS